MRKPPTVKPEDKPKAIFPKYLVRKEGPTPDTPIISGPYTMEALQTMAYNGVVTRDTELAKKGENTYRPAGYWYFRETLFPKKKDFGITPLPETTGKPDAPGKPIENGPLRTREDIEARLQKDPNDPQAVQTLNAIKEHMATQGVTAQEAIDALLIKEAPKQNIRSPLKTEISGTRGITVIAGILASCVFIPLIFRATDPLEKTNFRECYAGLLFVLTIIFFFGKKIQERISLVTFALLVAGFTLTACILTITGAVWAAAASFSFGQILTGVIGMTGIFRLLPGLLHLDKYVATYYIAALLIGTIIALIPGLRRGPKLIIAGAIAFIIIGPIWDRHYKGKRTFALVHLWNTPKEKKAIAEERNQIAQARLKTEGFLTAEAYSAYINHTEVTDPDPDRSSKNVWENFAKGVPDARHDLGVWSDQRVYNRARQALSLLGNWGAMPAGDMDYLPHRTKEVRAVWNDQGIRPPSRAVLNAIFDYMQLVDPQNQGHYVQEYSNAELLVDYMENH